MSNEQVNYTLHITDDKAGSFFILSVYNQLSVNEIRLFTLSLSLLRQSGDYDESEGLNIRGSELVKIFGGNKGYYNELKEICKRLYEKKIVFEEKIYPIFSFLRFSGNMGGLYLRFNPQILPHLLADYREMTEQEAFSLKSIYAIRIIELLAKSARDAKIPPGQIVRLIISVDDLKKYLGVPNTKTYEQLTNIRNKILKHPLEEINENSLYQVNYDVVKDGRRVKAFVFTYSREVNTVPHKKIV